MFAAMYDTFFAPVQPAVHRDPASPRREIPRTTPPSKDAPKRAACCHQCRTPLSFEGRNYGPGMGHNVCRNCAVSCHRCKRIIQGRYEMMKDGTCWHIGCLNCVLCNAQLTGDAVASEKGGVECLKHTKNYQPRKEDALRL